MERPHRSAAHADTFANTDSDSIILSVTIAWLLRVSLGFAHSVSLAGGVTLSYSSICLSLGPAKPADKIKIFKIRNRNEKIAK